MPILNHDKSMTPTFNMSETESVKLSQMNEHSFRDEQDHIY